MKVVSGRVQIGCQDLVNNCRSRGWWQRAADNNRMHLTESGWPLEVNMGCGIVIPECCCALGPCDCYSFLSPRNDAAWWIDPSRPATNQFFGALLKAMTISEISDPSEGREVTIELALVGNGRASVQAGRDALRRLFVHGPCTDDCEGVSLSWHDCDRGGMWTLPNVWMVGGVEHSPQQRESCNYEVVTIVLRSRRGSIFGEWEQFHAEKFPTETTQLVETTCAPAPVKSKARSRFAAAVAAFNGGAVAGPSAWCQPWVTLPQICAPVPVSAGWDVRVDLFAGSYDLANVEIVVEDCVGNRVGDQFIVSVPARETLRVVGRDHEGSGLRPTACPIGASRVCVIADGTIRDDDTPRTAPDAEARFYWRRTLL